MMAAKAKRAKAMPPNVIAFPASRRVRPTTASGAHTALTSAIVPLLSAVTAAGSALHALRVMGNPSNLIVVSAAQRAMDESTQALKAVLDSILSLDAEGGAA